MLKKLLIVALDLPDCCFVDKRIPKKMMIDNGASTSADKRMINDCIEEIQWMAVLKPNTVGVATYRDDEREYLEIAVLSVSIRQRFAGGTSNNIRLMELVHRAVPYPVLLLLATPKGLFLSLVHKRWAYNELGKVILDGELIAVDITSNDMSDQRSKASFIKALALGCQPQVSLLTLYQGWLDCLVAWQAAQITGRFTKTSTSIEAAIRRKNLCSYKALELKGARLRVQASKETQMARQVALNLELQRINATMALVREQL